MKTWSILLSLVSLACFQQQLFAQEQHTCTNVENGICLNSDASVIPEKSAKIAKGANEKGVPPAASMQHCEDRYPQQCPHYANDDQCNINPGWMIVNCPKSCNACHLRDPKVRCDRNFLNISTTPIYQPGDMQRIFSGMKEKYGELYDLEVMSTDPWVMVFHNFVSEEEGEAIIDSVKDHWERSTDTGKVNEFGETGRTVSLSRTSSNAWCRRECETNPLVAAVMHRIEEVTQIPTNNFESFQILRYEEGQYYRTHHDMGE
jgi:prolyl 4-hydroxylase